MRSIWLLSLIVLVGGCSAPRRMSAKAFQEKYAAIEVVGTISETAYLGQREGKAFLRVSRMNLLSQRWTTQDYYVDLDALDPEFRKTLPTEGFSIQSRAFEYKRLHEARSAGNSGTNGTDP